MSQEELAIELDCKQAFISQIETGKSLMPDSLFKILKAKYGDEIISYNNKEEVIKSSKPITGELLASIRRSVEDDVDGVSIDKHPNGGAPYWNLPVSAGRSIVDITGKQKPDGYIKGLPGADIAEHILPVAGASMEPEISSGAIIGVRKMNNWDTLNTERVYLIITQDDRMIKRIEHDADKSEILWCISPNYPKFKVYKSDIVEIQRVCFVYNPK